VPCKLRLKFFHRPGCAGAPTALPGCAHEHPSFDINKRQENKNIKAFTSPLGEERVDVGECFEYEERLVKARLVAVDEDHQCSLECQVRQSTLTSL